MNRVKLQASPLLFLWLIAGATALALSLFSLAETRFAAIQQRQIDETLLAEILADVAYDNNLLEDAFLLEPAAGTLVRADLLGLTERRTAYIARQQGQPIAVVLPVETLAGYNGSIQLLMGITVEGEITGVRIVTHNETPRLGDKFELAYSIWVLNFNRRSLDNTDPLLWRVKKDGGEFDQFAGATITPRAVVAAVRDGLEFFTANRDGLLNVNSTGIPPPAAAQGHLIASAGITAWLAAMTQPLPLFLLALLLALKNFVAPGHSPPAAPPADIAPGSKRVRVTGKS